MAEGEGKDKKTSAESREIKLLDPKQTGPFPALVKRFERAYVDIGVLNLKGQIISGIRDPLNF